MTKEEKIKEAYGNLWDKVKSNADENGFVQFKVTGHGETNNMHYEWDFNLNYLNIESVGYAPDIKWRPISLSDIENNNGWTVLNKESYEELENGYYMWYNNTNGDWEIDDLSDTHIDNYTHFQKIIVPPKPPIY